MIKLFNENHINSDFQETFKNAVRAVENLSEYELQNESSTELTERIVENFKEKPLEVDLENKSATVEMINIPGNRFPPGYDVSRGKSYPCARVKYSFDIKSDNSKFLYALPTNHRFDNVTAEVDNLVKLHIYYQTMYGNSELSDDVKKEVKNWIVDLVPKIKTTINLINKDIQDFNDGMKPKIKELIEKRIEQVNRKNKQNDDLADF